MKILLTVAYDGTQYAGWQRQKNAVTVQQRLEESLCDLLQQSVKLIGASRTDAGVHAEGQRAAFDIEALPLPVEKLPFVLNNSLPQDIAVIASEVRPDDFHPRFDAKQKTYRYTICNAAYPDPFSRRYSAYVPQKINISEMKNAARFFIGRHDFASFCAAGGSNVTTVRRVIDCSLHAENNIVTLTVTGEAFLYNMVRIIAGTLLYVGLGKIESESVAQIINSRDRSRAGV
ncbi:MAG: tRNA pseudouridine(38-40) synthase TruA, partial [Defluviitaleaceae bacterium]|nr:tRNA pseudouridine(38-40) synthase TruA [Defluviitaleaceae bacterium]